jgi:hypothetical protein
MTLAGYVFNRAGTYDLGFVILSAVAMPETLLVSTLRPMLMKEQEG